MSDKKQQQKPAQPTAVSSNVLLGISPVKGNGWRLVRLDLQADGSYRETEITANETTQVAMALARRELERVLT